MSEFGEALNFVVESGRIKGESAKERMASAIEEVQFELAEQGLAEYNSDAEKYVRRHYNPN